MLYVLHGTDRDKGLAKIKSLVAALKTKKSDTVVFRFDDETFDPEKFKELVASQGLFQSNYVVVLDGVLGQAETRETIEGELETVKTSPHVVVFWEREIPAAAKFISAAADKVQEFVLKAKPAEVEFNVFGLADALAERDRKKLWVLFHQALRAGLAPEEVFWKLVWQVKAILVAGSAKTAAEAGQKPFVFSKAMRALKNFSHNELADLSRRLVALYHDARRGLVDFDLGLEQLILEV